MIYHGNRVAATLMGLNFFVLSASAGDGPLLPGVALEPIAQPHLAQPLSAAMEPTAPSAPAPQTAPRRAATRLVPRAAMPSFDVHGGEKTPDAGKRASAEVKPQIGQPPESRLIQTTPAESLAMKSAIPDHEKKSVLTPSPQNLLPQVDPKPFVAPEQLRPEYGSRRMTQRAARRGR
jgi:hypothetical protein